MLLRHWMRESIRPIDRGRLAPGHDGNPLVSVPFKMSGLEGHRSLQAVKRRSVPLHHQVFHLAFVTSDQTAARFRTVRPFCSFRRFATSPRLCEQSCSPSRRVSCCGLPSIAVPAPILNVGRHAWRPAATQIVHHVLAGASGNDWLCSRYHRALAFRRSCIGAEPVQSRQKGLGPMRSVGHHLLRRLERLRQSVPLRVA